MHILVQYLLDKPCLSMKAAIKKCKLQFGTNEASNSVILECVQLKKQQKKEEDMTLPGFESGIP